ncbi:MAG: hypothetical protein Kow0059_09700 [Candidatus Sumerlaeia bacterium]
MNLLWGADAEDLSKRAEPPTEAFECHLPTVPTTPVAYMTSLFPDTIWNQKGGHGKDTPMHYNERKTTDYLGEPYFLQSLTCVILGCPNTSAQWYLFSHGPDNDHDESLDGSDSEFAIVAYDPTNGTISNGDIYTFGPGLSVN